MLRSTDKVICGWLMMRAVLLTVDISLFFFSFHYFLAPSSLCSTSLVYFFGIINDRRRRRPFWVKSNAFSRCVTIFQGCAARCDARFYDATKTETETTMTPNYRKKSRYWASSVGTTRAPVQWEVASVVFFSCFEWYSCRSVPLTRPNGLLFFFIGLL